MKKNIYSNSINLNLGDGFLKMAITLLSDFPKQIELDGKLVLTDKYLYELITNIMSTLVVVPVCNLKEFLNKRFRGFFRIILMVVFYILHKVYII